MRLGIGVGEQWKGASFAGVIARRAVVKKNRSEVAIEGDTLFAARWERSWRLSRFAKAPSEAQPSANIHAPIVRYEMVIRGPR